MLKDKLKNLPSRPGVYHFLDENGDILYIGKAKNLKNRVKQYFLKELNRGPGIEQMVSIARDVRVIETDSEIEAILLEADQINKLQPKYNSRQKDDKSFFAIRIAKKENPKSKFLISNQIPNSKLRDKWLKNNDETIEQSNNVSVFPSVELVRFRNIDLDDKSADYFGPYPRGEMLKKSLRYLRRIFPYRDCSLSKWRTYQKKNRPCLYGDIQLCDAPCVGRVDQEKYWQNIQYLKDFLRNKKKNVIKNLEKEMKVQSQDQNFEAAAETRNKLLALEHLGEVRVGLRDDHFDLESILFHRIECYDISNLGEKEAVGSMVVFNDGKADKEEYKKFKIVTEWQGDRGTEREISEPPVSDLERMEQVLQRRFKNDWPMPDLIIIDGGETHLMVARKVLKEYHLNVPVISISKGAKRAKNDFHFADAATAEYFKKNISLQKIAIMARDESHRFAINYHRSLHRKNIFEK